MIWFSQSESMGDAQCFLWLTFSKPPATKEPLAFVVGCRRGTDGQCTINIPSFHSCKQILKKLWNYEVRSFVKKSVSPLNAAFLGQETSKRSSFSWIHHQLPRLSQGHKSEPRQQADLVRGRWRVFTINGVRYCWTCLVYNDVK